MYCKYCGKEIDEDSSFCKHCGKQLEEKRSFVSLSENSLLIKICLAILWIAYSIILPKGLYWYDEDNSMSILYLLITPFIFYVIYYINQHFLPFPISLNISDDTIKTKLVKSAYIIYSLLLPAFCCEHGYADEYFGLMAFLWLLPTIFICFLFYYFKSRKNKQTP